jgi:hypothetical protein
MRRTVVLWSKDEEVEIREEIERGNVLGSGVGGKVYAGTWGSVKVAMKKLKSGFDVNLQEAKTMKYVCPSRRKVEVCCCFFRAIHGLCP